MSLQQRVTDDLKSAMMAREAVRTATLRMLKAALGYAQIEKKTDTLSDAEVMAVIQREAKKRRDAIEEFEKGGRAEMAANERAELEVLAGFLPKALSPEELEALVRGVIAEVGATSKKEMGAVMKAAQARIDGRADGRSVSALVSRLLP
ncbi:MAG: GatB/YqeY domain-containing protein [Verrucomicrobiota bacterium]